jgi:hypothetical protein
MKSCRTICDALLAMHDIDVLAAPSVQSGTDFRQA